MAPRRRRRDTRYSIEFPVQLTHARRSHALVTQDVSDGGVFLKTDAPPPLLHLVQVRLVLPVGGYALTAHAMTVHVVTPENAVGRAAGIGVQFYALDSSTRDAWAAFASYVEARHPASTDQTPLRLTRGVTPEPLSRRFGNHTAVLEWKPSRLDDLEEAYTQDISNGSLFVATGLDLAAGANVVVSITHPETRAPFLFEARVLHRQASPPGLRVELRGVDRVFREEFLEFVRGTVIVDEESVA